MNGWAWAAIIILGLESLLQIAFIGKVRSPRTPKDATLSIVEFGIIAWLIVMAVTS